RSIISPMNWKLRMATLDDAAGIAEIYEPIVRSKPISFVIEVPSEQEIRRRIERIMTAYPWLVCEYRHRLAGYAYASRHAERAAYQWSVDTSIYVHSDFRRRRVGQGLYKSLFRILVAQGYYNAYAGIPLPNHGCRSSDMGAVFPNSRIEAVTGKRSLGILRRRGQAGAEGEFRGYRPRGDHGRPWIAAPAGSGCSGKRNTQLAQGGRGGRERA